MQKDIFIKKSSNNSSENNRKKKIRTFTEEKTTDEQYSSMSLHQHILTIPDTYIGSVNDDLQRLWIFDEEKKIMINKEIKNINGLYKIFDEIIVNARDHTERDSTCKNIRVWISKETGIISVYNDGNKGIPIEIHSEENMYVPEMIFSKLLTSGGYNQTGKVSSILLKYRLVRTPIWI